MLAPLRFLWWLLSDSGVSGWLLSDSEVCLKLETSKTNVDHVSPEFSELSGML